MVKKIGAPGVFFSPEYGILKTEKGVGDPAEKFVWLARKNLEMVGEVDGSVPSNFCYLKNPDRNQW